MKISKCSASSIGLYYHCAFAYFIQYILEQESGGGKSALQGSIVHQALDWMAKIKAKNKTQVCPMKLLNKSWDRSVRQSPGIEIRKTTTRKDKETGNPKEAADFKKCRLAMEAVLADPHYNPYLLDVMDSEGWFEIPIPGKNWRCDDNQFTARGFIDLVHKIDDETIEIIDWKTGKRQNFYTQQPINELSLIYEIQARLYHMAAYFAYPGYKNILVTFYYTNDGGPVTVPFSPDDVDLTIEILYKFMNQVRKDTLLSRNRKWTCRMCSFNKNDMCQTIWSDFCTFGSEYTKARHTMDGVLAD